LKIDNKQKNFDIINHIENKENILIVRKHKNERMSKIVEHNGIVYFAGIVSDDTTLDITGQTKRVLEIAEEWLAESKSDTELILRSEIYVKNIDRDFVGFNSVWDAWVSKENPPTRACVEANMSSENILVEVILTAVQKAD
jgi:enamine deaminase RidA (YjgF/YER057c/UK114 family)